MWKKILNWIDGGNAPKAEARTNGTNPTKEDKKQQPFEPAPLVYAGPEFESIDGDVNRLRERLIEERKRSALLQIENNQLFQEVQITRQFVALLKRIEQQSKISEMEHLRANMAEREKLMGMIFK